MGRRVLVAAVGASVVLAVVEIRVAARVAWIVFHGAKLTGGSGVVGTRLLDDFSKPVLQLSRLTLVIVRVPAVRIHIANVEEHEV